MSNRVVTKIVRTKRNTGTTERLRHGARTPEQEYKRDVEMREALKAAKKQAEKAWWT